MLRIVTVAVVVLVVVMDAEAGRPSPSPSCRSWCKRPGHPEKNAFYCCDFGIGTVGKPFATHPGKCPHRPICPEGLYTRGPAPTVCAHDGQCSKHEKCCADACLEHHTCLLADP
ncbi:uncharacterized protein LOC135111402 [Scylla paramamosain]|uniref:Type I crustin 6 n=1 Tax=Scylla paramamosain TaxID=85552 RepID=A0A343T7I5_SCYPA|nr:type I crustin 6 [Scylla paramamosain]